MHTLHDMTQNQYLSRSINTFAITQMLHIHRYYAAWYTIPTWWCSPRFLDPPLMHKHQHLLIHPQQDSCWYAEAWAHRCKPGPHQEWPFLLTERPGVQIHHQIYWYSQWPSTTGRWEQTSYVENEELRSKIALTIAHYTQKTFSLKPTIISTTRK